VREAMTMERMPKERETFIATLMRDAYVEIAKDYRESVAALLKTAPPKGGPVKANGDKKDDKKDDKKKSDDKKN
jgi:hypothetical protein